MSTMLEQAIVDASALREAAIQNAEQAVVAKFSTQIKETVETLLEQDEMELPETPPGETPTQEAPETYGKNEIAAEDEDPKSPIEKQLDKITGKAYAFGDDADKTQFELGEDELIEIDLEKIVAEGVVDVDEESLKEMINAADIVEIDENDLKKLAAKDKEGDAPEQIDEKITFDHVEQRTGWMSGPDKYILDAKMIDSITKAIEELNYEQEKKNKKTKKENKELKEKNNKLTKETKELLAYSQKLYEAISKLKEKFDDVQLVNTKLLYTNKVLQDESLNKRQKQEIVESINQVDDIEKAKLVYETLQSAAGISFRKSPESLSEAVGRHTSTSILLKSHKEGQEENVTNTFANRMKRLAGI